MGLYNFCKAAAAEAGDHPEAGLSSPEAGSSRAWLEPFSGAELEPLVGASHPEAGPEADGHPEAGLSRPEAGASHPEAGPSHAEAGLARVTGKTRATGKIGRPAGSIFVKSLMFVKPLELEALDVGGDATLEPLIE